MVEFSRDSFRRNVGGHGRVLLVVKAEENGHIFGGYIEDILMGYRYCDHAYTIVLHVVLGCLLEVLCRAYPRLYYCTTHALVLGCVLEAWCRAYIHIYTIVLGCVLEVMVMVRAELGGNHIGAHDYGCCVSAASMVPTQWTTHTDTNSMRPLSCNLSAKPSRGF